MKQIEYDWMRPLMRLEIGDIAVIKVEHSNRESVRIRKKYGKVPNGVYKAKVIAPYELECQEYPVLSGKYCYWYGYKWGCTGTVWADEVRI